MAHGGSIDVASAVGSGTRFTVNAAVLERRMSARPARRLRVAAGADASAPAAVERPVQLVSALTAAGRVARAEGLAAVGVIGHELRLPGIGGRYLAGIAAHAHARGWGALEVVALLDAVEARSAMWVVTPVGRRPCAGPG